MSDLAAHKDTHPPSAAAVTTTAAATGIITATTTSRAILLQITHLYLRSPAKLFRPPRWDYLTPTRILLEPELRNKPWNFFTHSSLALIYQSVRKKGFAWVTEQIMPPLIANAVIGGVLYGTYLYTLNSYMQSRKHLLEEQMREEKLYQESFYGYPIGVINALVRTYVTTWDTFKAGFIAGGVSSMLASPLDALYSRSTYSELVKGKIDRGGIWVFAWEKLKQVGPMGIMAGFWLNFVKESVGFGAYFAIFESVKNYGYFTAKSIVDTFSSISQNSRELLGLEKEKQEVGNGERVLRLSFVLLAGASAGYALMGIQYPINKIQKVHLARLEALDLFTEGSRAETSRWFKLYYHSYTQTWDILCQKKTQSGLKWSRFLYKGFHNFALANIPATSIGLLIFEIGREKLSNEFEGEDWLEP